MILYTSGLYQTKYTTSYGRKRIINNVQDFKDVVSKEDYTFAKFADGRTQSGKWVKNHRSNTDWLESDILYCDFDDGYSIEEFKKDFNRYEWYITTSKSHQKLKHGKRCDRFHAVFPLHYMVQDRETHKQYLRILHKYFFKMDKMDKACIDTARFFYANKDTEVFYNEGKSIGHIIHQIYLKQPEEKRVEQKEIKLDSRYNKQILKKVDKAHKYGWFDSYQTWIYLGMALKSSGFDLDVWERYCNTEKDIRMAQYKWKGFSEDGEIGKQYLLNICRKIKF